ncbi:MAG: DUF721 domain-containing protein [Hyphomonadaceae bacterium]|nr:DUF721 domain-containing protein [Hyphomonadaceae bacterium]
MFRRRAETIDPDLEARASALLEARRGRKIIQPPPAANRFLSPLIKPLLAKAGVGINELKRNWKDIVGEQFAQTEPEKLTGKVLTIRVPGAFAAFVQHHEALILERCRTAGAKAEKLAIRQGLPARPAAGAAMPLPRRPLATGPEPALEEVASPQLRAALQRLGRAVRSA